MIQAGEVLGGLVGSLLPFVLRMASCLVVALFFSNSHFKI